MNPTLQTTLDPVKRAYTAPRAPTPPPKRQMPHRADSYGMRESEILRAVYSAGGRTYTPTEPARPSPVERVWAWLKRKFKPPTIPAMD